MAHRCRAHQGSGCVEHLAQSLGSEVIDEQENKAHPSDGDGRDNAQFCLLITDQHGPHDEREDGGRSSKNEVRRHRCRLWRTDLDGVFRKWRTVAMWPVGVRRVPSLRAGGREDPIVRVVGGHQRGLLEEPVVDAVAALFSLGLKDFWVNRLLSHLVKPG